MKQAQHKTSKPFLKLFIVTFIVAAVLTIDGLITKLPIYSYENRGSDILAVTFAVELAICITVQVMYLRLTVIKKVFNFGYFKLNSESLRRIIMGIQLLIMGLASVVLVQIVISDSYSSDLVQTSIIISSVASISVLTLLLLRFTSWFSISHNRLLLAYTLAVLAMVVNSLVILLYSYFSFLNSFDLITPDLASINNTPFTYANIKSVYLITSILQYSSTWIASVILLRSYSLKIGRIKFWIMMMLPLLYFVSKFQFLFINIFIEYNIMSPIEFYRFYTLFFAVTDLVGGFTFGIVFWTLSRNVSDNSIKYYMNISGIGIFLFFISSQVTGITILPYPPFGLLTNSFMALASYLLFVGIYQSAIRASADPIIRTSIRKSVLNEVKFLNNIGASEMSERVTNTVSTAMKNFVDKISEDTNYNISDLDYDINDYVRMAIIETQRMRYKGGETLLYSRTDSPLGQTWEKWVESWWTWCYYDPYGENPADDRTGKLSSKGQVLHDVWYLAGTFGGKAQRTCQVPKGMSIFFPIINDLISFHTDQHLKTESELHAYAKADLDHTLLLAAKVDGCELQNLNSYRVHSSLFQITLPVEAGRSAPVRTQAVSDGYWIFLKPLAPGEHKIEFMGEKLAFDRIIQDGASVENLPKFHVEVKYTMQVV
jgi:hypothetical protein